MPRWFLLDTHILVRWVSEARRLTKEQARVLENAVIRGDPVGISAMTLLELAALSCAGKLRGSIESLFARVSTDPMFVLLPITVEIATEVATMGGALSDPADRAIVATARVHRLRLITSDQRIIQSRLVSVVD
jgi:PIN domain nuclease of toxin-antitoxin system